MINYHFVMKFTESSIIQNNEIAINEVLWTHLNEQLSQPEIIDLISVAIEKYNLPLPIRKISLEDALEDFQNLQHLDCRRLWKKGEVFTKHQYKYPIENIYLELNKTGNKSSDYFHQTNRNLCS